MPKHSHTEHALHDHQHGQRGWIVEDMAKDFNDPSRDEWQKPYEVIALFGDAEGKTVLDLGAGTGYFTFKLAEQHARSRSRWTNLLPCSMIFMGCSISCAFIA